VVVGVTKGEHFGKLYIATGNEDWAWRLGNWKKISWMPAPMPEGHLMFESPRGYGRGPVDGHVIIWEDGLWKLPESDAQALASKGIIHLIVGYQKAEACLYEFSEGFDKAKAVAFLDEQRTAQGELF